MRDLKKLWALVFVATLMAACTPVEPAAPEEAQPTESEEPETAMVLPEGDFEVNEGGAAGGSAYIKGHASINEVEEGFCVSDCKTFDYVSFVIEENNTPGLDTYIKQNAGNSFVGENSIGLGCVDNGMIHYFNDSDEDKRQEFELGADESAAILASSEENPIALKVTKEKLTFGAGAPDCYSHFTKVEQYEG